MLLLMFPPPQDVSSPRHQWYHRGLNFGFDSGLHPLCCPVASSGKVMGQLEVPEMKEYPSQKSFTCTDLHAAPFGEEISCYLAALAGGVGRVVTRGWALGQVWSHPCYLLNPPHCKSGSGPRWLDNGIFNCALNEINFLSGSLTSLLLLMCG